MKCSRGSVEMCRAARRVARYGETFRLRQPAPCMAVLLRGDFLSFNHFDIICILCLNLSEAGEMLDDALGLGRADERF